MLLNKQFSSDITLSALSIMSTLYRLVRNAKAHLKLHCNTSQATVHRKPRGWPVSETISKIFENFCGWRDPQLLQHIFRAAPNCSIWDPKNTFCDHILRAKWMSHVLFCSLNGGLDISSLQPKFSFQRFGAQRMHSTRLFTILFSMSRNKGFTSFRKETR